MPTDSPAMPCTCPCLFPRCFHCPTGEPLAPEDNRMFLQFGPVSIINMQL